MHIFLRKIKQNIKASVRSLQVKRKDDSGFTLAEVLIVVAIMSILAGFGFVAVSQYNKRLTLLEMDDTAKKIFLAAQNHLTVSDTNGEWKQLRISSEAGDSSDESNPSLGIPCTFIDGGYTVIYGGKDNRGNGSNNVTEALNLILPPNAVNLAGDGSYAIVYNPKTATIYGVYYSSSSTFGNGQSEYTFADIIPRVNRDNSKERLKNNPLIGYYGNATPGTEKTPGTELESLKKIDIRFINDAKSLRLQITDPNNLSLDTLTIQVEGKESGKIETLSCKGNTLTVDQDTLKNYSGLSSIWAANPVKSIIEDDSTVTTVVFDQIASDETTEASLKHGNLHFANLFPAFYRGEDISATVTLKYTDTKTGTQIVSGTASDNSLFAQIYPYSGVKTISATGEDSADESIGKLVNNASSKGKYTARVSNIRHLENLSTEISDIKTFGSEDASSNTAFSVAKAVLDENLNFTNDCFSSGTTIYGYIANGTPVSKTLSDVNSENFIGIKPDEGLSVFDGNGEALSNMKVIGTPFDGSGEAKGTGLFTTVKKATSESARSSDLSKLTFYISNLSMANPEVKSGEAAVENSTTAGIVAGYFEGDYLSIQNVNIYGNVNVTAQQQAGGILGYASAKETIDLGNVHIARKNTDQATNVSIESENSTAGGLVGTVNVKKLIINDVSVKEIKSDSSTTGYTRVQSKGTDKAHTGGLIGYLCLLDDTTSEGSTITACSVEGGQGGFIETLEKGNASGLIGLVERAASCKLQIQSCQVHGIRVLTKDGNAGGFIGSLNDASNATVDGAGNMTISRSMFTNPTDSSPNGVGAKANYDIYTSSIDGSAGGLIGTSGLKGIDSKHINRTNWNLTISDCEVSSEYRFNIAAKKQVGGLIGGFYGNNLSITGTLVSGKYMWIQNETKKDKGNSDGSCAGGLIGECNAGSSAVLIQNCGAGSYVYAKKADCAGGLIGSLKAGDTNKILDTYVSGHTKQGFYSDTEYVGTMETTGGYNVYGCTATGGFIGYTSANSLQVKNCTSATSVYSDIHNASYGIVGGFVGQTQVKKDIIFNQCYSVGKTFGPENLENSYIGSFIGNINNKRNASTWEGYDFIKSFVLTGVAYNSVQTIGGVSDDTLSEADKERLGQINKVPKSNLISIAAIKTSPFDTTLASKTYPYPITATLPDYINNQFDSTYRTIWYVGDWAEPEEPETYDEPINSNRSYIEHAFSSDDFDSNNQHIWSMKITGATSGKTLYFNIIVTKNSDGTYTQTVKYGETPQNAEYTDWWGSNKGRGESYIKNGDSSKVISRFYFDDISQDSEDFSALFWNMIPGENITIKVRDEKTSHLDAESIWDGIEGKTINSLYDSIVSNADGTDTDTYTAKIANSRHLLNLNKYIATAAHAERLSDKIKITKAVQVDNIIWSNDTNYGQEYANRKTEPYLHEVGQDVNVEDQFDSNTAGTRTYAGGTSYADNNTFPGITPLDTLTEYDGNNYFLNNFCFYSSLNDKAGGLFNNLTNNTFTIKNIKFKNVFSKSKDSNSAGLLVGKIDSGKTCNISNIKILGTQNSIYASGYGKAGGLVGINEGTLNVNGLELDSDHFSVYSESSYSGGILGASTGNVNILNANLKSPDTIIYADGDQSRVGGFIGDFTNADKTVKIEKCLFYSDQGSIRTTSTNSDYKYVGGIVGSIWGKVDIQEVNVAGRNLSINGNNANIGGVIGYLGSSVCTLKSIGIYGDTLHVYPYAGVYAGGLVAWAQVDGPWTIENTFASDYIDARNTMYVGGLIGSLNLRNNKSQISISKSYVGGRTKDATYGINTIDFDKAQDKATNFNIIGNQYVGGFIGYINGDNYPDNTYNVTMAQNFSVASCFTFNGAGTLGALIGDTESNVKMAMDQCYSAGKIGYSQQQNMTANIGSFIGKIGNGTSITKKNQSWTDGYVTGASENSGYQPIGKNDSGIAYNNFALNVSALQSTKLEIPTDYVDEKLGSSKYPYICWTTWYDVENTKDQGIYYFGDWDQEYYSQYVAPRLPDQTASTAKVSPFTVDTMNETEMASMNGDGAMLSEGYLTPAGISTETQPDLVTKKQVIK